MIVFIALMAMLVVIVAILLRSIVNSLLGIRRIDREIARESRKRFDYLLSDQPIHLRTDYLGEKLACCGLAEVPSGHFVTDDPTFFTCDGTNPTTDKEES